MIASQLPCLPERIRLSKRLANRLKENLTLLAYWFIDKMQVSQRELEPVPNIFNKIGDLLLKPFINKELLTQILMGPFSFQTFRVSHELGFFNFLNQHPGATLDEMCQQLRLEKYGAEVLLLGLTALKLINKIGQRYYNSALIKVVTQDNTNKFTYFFPKYMQYAQHILIEGIHHLQESITLNQPVGLKKIFGEQASDYYYELSKDSSKNHYFSQHMSAFSQINAQRLATLPLLNQIDRLMDVGGGIGSVAMSIATHHPKLHITVYDHPSVAEIASKRFDEANMRDRLTAIGGDVLATSFPEGYDGILFSHFIDIFSPEQNVIFLEKAFAALKSKGYIIIYTPVINDNETGPLVNCLLGIYFLTLANGQGRFYSALHISNWLKQVGFSKIHIERLPANEAIIIGCKN